MIDVFWDFRGSNSNNWQIVRIAFKDGETFAETEARAMKAIKRKAGSRPFMFGGLGQ